MVDFPTIDVPPSHLLRSEVGQFIVNLSIGTCFYRDPSRVLRVVLGYRRVIPFL